MPESGCLFNSSENDSYRAGRGIGRYGGGSRLNCLIKVAFELRYETALQKATTKRFVNADDSAKYIDL